MTNTEAVNEDFKHVTAIVIIRKSDFLKCLSEYDCLLEKLQNERINTLHVNKVEEYIPVVQCAQQL